MKFLFLLASICCLVSMYTSVAENPLFLELFHNLFLLSLMAVSFEEFSDKLRLIVSGICLIIDGGSCVYVRTLGFLYG